MSPGAETSRTIRAAVFGVAITLGACLLFQIQFVLAKLILPWFGGSASVWSTALVVFQVLLLAGYAYAHALAGMPTRRQQIGRHAVLVAAVLAVLLWRAATWPSPVTPDDAWKPDPDGSPVLQILLLLTGGIGLPFVVLASTSPLLQRWYADLQAHVDDGGASSRSPYRLYALSNLGSLVGLVSYPLLIEPRLDVFQQGRWWTVGYVLFAAATLACARIVAHVPIARAPVIEPEPLRAVESPQTIPNDPDSHMATVGAAPRSVRRSLGEGRAGLMGHVGDVPLPMTMRVAGEDDACATLVARSLGEGRSPAATSPQIRDDLLWLALAAVPAALLQSTTTKITQDIAAVPFLWMVPLALYLLTFIVAFEYPRLYNRHVLALAVAAGTLATLPEWPNRVTLAIALAMLTATGLSLHGELAARAPAPGWLTRYYLVVSAGGVVGSAVVALGAPIAFDGLVEYPLTLVAALIVLAIVYVTASWRLDRGAARLAWVVAALLTCLGLYIGGHTALEWDKLTSDAVFTSRSFFGAIRVREQEFDTGERYRRLQHGTTLHGMQYLQGEKSRQPIAYYTPASGLGQVMSALTALGRPARVGVVGLGTGTLAAYGRTGDAFTFFEIDPQVVALSTAPTPLFTYLRDSDASITIVGGDARLSLERARPYAFDVLVLDAFSSDAVPVHLLTREAFAVYARHLLSPASILVVHVSNRYLDLEGIVQAGAASAGFTSVQVEHDLVDNDTERTTWMVLARDTDALKIYGTAYAPTGVRAWTDASSNLLGVLRR